MVINSEGYGITFALLNEEESKTNSKGEQVMTKISILILAGAFFAVSMVPASVFAGKGAMRTGGQGIQIKQQTMQQNQIKIRNGASGQSTQTKTATMEKKGNTYGPGDGTGNKGVGPQDGTGYGAPSNR